MSRVYVFLAHKVEGNDNTLTNGDVILSHQAEHNQRAKVSEPNTDLRSDFWSQALIPDQEIRPVLLQSYAGPFFEISTAPAMVYVHRLCVACKSPAISFWCHVGCNQ